MGQSAESSPASQSLTSRPVAKGGKAAGPWVNQLPATWQEVRLCSLHPPERHRTTWCRQSWGNRASPQSTENRNVTAARGQDLVLFHELHVWGQGEGKEKEPCWEEELAEPTSGQKGIVSKLFPNWRENRSKSGSDCGH